MKRLIFKIGVGLLTLGVGLGSSWLWDRYRPASLETITAYHNYYEGKTVRIRALLDLSDVGSKTSNGYEPEYYVMAPCPREECSASVSFDEDVRLANLQPYHFISVRGEEIPPQPIRLADIVLVGTLDPSSDEVTHCFAPRYHLSHARIERVITKYQFDSIQHAYDWVRQNSH